MEINHQTQQTDNAQGNLGYSSHRGNQIFERERAVEKKHVGRLQAPVELRIML